MDACDREKVLKAVLKRAVGYRTKEKVDELVYSEDGGLTLSKRRVTQKDVPGDMAAAKLLLEMDGGDLSSYTDEQLIEMRDELFRQLKKEVEEE